MVQKFTPQKSINVVWCLLMQTRTSQAVFSLGRVPQVFHGQSFIRRKRVLCLGKSSCFWHNGNQGTATKLGHQCKSPGVHGFSCSTWHVLGLGKSRHIQTRYLWIQEKLAERTFELIKIDTKLNTSDICTKALASEAAERHLRAMGFEVAQGRSSIAKAVVCSVPKWTMACIIPMSRRGDSGHLSS